MAWRLANSLKTLLAQVNEAWPLRSKASDGTIGDPAHAARKSDHNPGADGVVQALDITHDPEHGVVAGDIADALIASRDSRIRYVISNARIARSYDGPGYEAWEWTPYTGANAHRKHVHVSVRDGATFYDDPREWQIVALPAPEPLPAAVLRRGDSGADVERLQAALTEAGFPLVADGDFGPATERAVVNFQDAHNLGADGAVGKRTWAALRAHGVQ